MTATPRIRLGTRSSALARRQSEWVAARLAAEGVEVELVAIRTTGDRRDGPIAQLGGRGVFTREIQRALLAGRIDLAVHSLKDLPTEPVDGLALAAVPPRAAPFDVLISGRHAGLARLPDGAVVGTGSPRRRAQLLHVRRDLRTGELRGNVDTRLRKLDSGEFDAIVLAEAGLERLGLESRIVERLPPEIMLPAAGQGALGLETRTDDAPVRRVLERLDDLASRRAVLAERAVLSALRGGCLAPVGVLGRCEGERLRLHARVLDPDGHRAVEAVVEGPAEGAPDLAHRLADTLLADGAAELIAAGRAARDDRAEPA